MLLMQQPTDQSVGQRIDVPGNIGQYLDIALVAGNIRYIALQWPLICPCIVTYSVMIQYCILLIIHGEKILLFHVITFIP